MSTSRGRRPITRASGEGEITVDTHVHLSTSDLLRYPRLAEFRFESRDFFNPVGSFLSAMNAADVTYATIVQPFALYGSDNSYHADSAISCPRRLRAICGLTPSEDAPASARFWLFERGMAGLRLYVGSEQDTLPGTPLDTMTAIAAEAAVPVTVVTSQQHIGTVATLAIRFAGVPVILDRLGGLREGVEGRLARLAPLAKIPNLYLKVTTAELLAPGGPELIAMLVATFGASRLLWGSNFPLTNLGGYARTVALSRSALSDLTGGDRREIFGEAARRIWFARPEYARRTPSRPAPLSMGNWH